MTRRWPKNIHELSHKDCRMTDKLRFTRAQIRNAAVIAKQEGVSIRIDADGSITVAPSANDNTEDNSIVQREVIRL